MSAKEFLIFFRRLIDRDMTSFVENMERLGLKDKPPHEWVPYLVKWLELGSEEDARRVYGEHYE